MNAAQVTREVKKQLRLAGLPAYPVSTHHTRLATRSPKGRMHGWQTYVYDLDGEAMEIVELVMGNLTGLIGVERGSTLLSIVTEEQP